MITYRGASRKCFRAVNGLFLLLVTLACAYPLWYILVQSLSGSLLAGKGIVWPYNFTLNNYRRVFQISGVFHAFYVSIARTAVGTCFTLFCSMLLGYLFTKREMPAHKFLYRMLTITMYISGGLIPTYIVIKTYGLLNNFWVYILPYAVSAYYVILIKTYIEQLPPSVEESAMIDGANTLAIFFRIILPMSLPILATIAVYASVAQWNAWFDNHIYTFSERNLTTLQYTLYIYLNEAELLVRQLEESASLEVDATAIVTPKGIRMTVTMITVLPVLCVYPFLQRFFIKGIAIGAVKG
ncbi:MAG: carbohydrate ABC transporter permease [Christensenellales bacterium]|jgi:putative aldouronate transport system permease protein